MVKLKKYVKLSCTSFFVVNFIKLIMNKYKWILIELLIIVSLITGIVYKKEKNQNVSTNVNTILVDPGHGGRDNGASFSNVLEDEINLSIGTKLYEKCITNNYIGYITRTTDQDLSSEDALNHKNEDLKKRAEYINTLNIDLFVSIHLNTYPSDNVHGPMVYYEKGNEDSYNLALEVQDVLNKLTNNKKKVTIGDYYLFKYTDAPGILVECGFLSNKKERELLVLETYQNLISSAIFEGIQNFEKLNEKK